MDREPLKEYCLSLPERVVRSVSALAGGLLRELGEATLPARVRRTRLYYNLVDSTLRFLIEQIGQVEGAYPEGGEVAKDFLVRRTAGNVVETAGILAFYASPVWVFAALADVSGAGRDLMGEIAQALEEEGLLEPGRRFENMDQLLEGLERTSGRMAENINTPPLDVAGLRKEWANMREEVRRLPGGRLPSPAMVRDGWQALRREAEAQEQSVFALSSVMALSAIRRLPENAVWLSRATQVGVVRTGEVIAETLLEHYRDTLAEIRETGYLRYWIREFRPYLAGALRQFSPKRPSTTAKLLKWRASRRRNPPGAPNM
jgi:hypothetical protein